MTQTNFDKRQAILNATEKLLATCGFHGFSMKQIAKEANVATGTIYLYFKDRETLITELHRNIVDDFAENVFRHHDKNLPLKEQYLLICRHVWDYCIAHRWATLGKGQFDHLPLDVLKSRHDDAWTNRLNPIIALYEQGRATQKIKPLSDIVLTSLSMEPFIHIAAQQLLGLVNINESELEYMMQAAWDAISQPST